MTFRNEILGAHVPFIISNRIYEMFSSPVLENGFEVEENGKTQYVMTYEDFKAFYVVFKDKANSEMADIAFEMFKMN